jgi:hypothetical protein
MNRQPGLTPTGAHPRHGHRDGADLDRTIERLRDLGAMILSFRARGAELQVERQYAARRTMPSSFAKPPGCRPR